jgi:hypothetical protein
MMSVRKMILTSSSMKLDMKGAAEAMQTLPTHGDVVYHGLKGAPSHPPTSARGRVGSFSAQLKRKPKKTRKSPKKFKNCSRKNKKNVNWARPMRQNTQMGTIRARPTNPICRPWTLQCIVPAGRVTWATAH